MMLADYFTKLIKGKMFKIFRDIIIGYKSISSMKSVPLSIKEHVVNNR